MPKKMLTFYDLVLLSIMERHEGEPLSQRLLRDRITDWIESRQIPQPAYLLAYKSKGTLSKALARLESMGLVSREGAHDTYDITGRAAHLLGKLDPDWATWPVEIPMSDGKPDWERANYVFGRVNIRS